MVKGLKDGKIPLMLSVVIPVYNEQESLRELYMELSKELPKLDKNFEIVFVDDGSTDHSLDKLKKLAKKDKRVRVFSFRKRSGKAEALSIGFAKANGDYIFTMDADLEDKPSEMHKLFSKLKEGYDVVSGWRKNRRHSFGRVISSKFSNFIIGLLWGLRLHDHNCGLKLFTREAARSSHFYGGLYRFMLLLAYQKGYKVTEVPIVHQNRKYGKSKFGALRLWKDIPDVFTILFLTKFAERPLHFFGIIGGLLFTLGSIILLYLAYLRFLGERIGDRPLLLFGVLIVLTGFQIFFTGFLAELIISKSTKEEPVPLKYSTQ